MRKLTFLAVAEPHVVPATLSFPEIPGLRLSADHALDAAADAALELQAYLDRLVTRGQPVPSPTAGLSRHPPFNSMIRFSIPVEVDDNVQLAPPRVDVLFPFADAV